MKRAVTVITVFLIAVVSAFALFGCADKSKEPDYEGNDVYGRKYGEIYDVDSESTGVFRIPYTTGDTSTMGKTMISAYCADHVTVEKKENTYFLTFYCNGSMLGSVVTVKDGDKTEGIQGEKDGYQSFAFELTQEDINAKISLECEVKPMNKTVGFSITLKLDEAKLVG